MDYKKQHRWYEKRWSLNKSYGGEKKIPNNEVVKFIKTIKKSNQHKKVLDLGCGEARHAIAFAKEGFETYGLDFSKNAIKKAKENARKANVSIKFSVGNGIKPPYQENSFDVVLDAGFLHHIKKKDWANYLRGLRRILRHGGLYWSMQLSKNSKRFHNFIPIDNKKNYYATKDTYTYFFTKEDYKSLFGKDFKILKIKEGPAFKKERKLLHFLGKLSKS